MIFSFLEKWHCVAFLAGSDLEMEMSEKDVGGPILLIVMQIFSESGVGPEPKKICAEVHTVIDVDPSSLALGGDPC